MPEIRSESKHLVLETGKLFDMYQAGQLVKLSRLQFPHFWCEEKLVPEIRIS